MLQVLSAKKYEIIESNRFALDFYSIWWSRFGEKG